ncbi:hypothetical protein KC929_00900 [Patescibacteria group bacterium]|nr:hypothetical protein [Patescibacteria group bacterium]
MKNKILSIIRALPIHDNETGISKSEVCSTLGLPSVLVSAVLRRLFKKLMVEEINLGKAISYRLCKSVDYQKAESIFAS